MKVSTGLKYKISVLITRLESGDYMARSEPLRATAIGVSREEAVIELLSKLGEAEAAIKTGKEWQPLDEVKEHLGI